jgi:ArsR family transcriptional regulator, arsenate/arsenite/antimonite-responsive transcriptional repressor
MADPPHDDQIARYADMMAALGTETRLRIVRLLLWAHPYGLVVGEIGSELGIPPSTLSHHLEKLKNENLLKVRRESTFLRYTANTQALRDILAFLFAECCTRNTAIKPEDITCCRAEPLSDPQTPGFRRLHRASCPDTRPDFRADAGAGRARPYHREPSCDQWRIVSR